MALIFTDRLRVTSGSGLYTLTGKINGQWQDIHQISGPADGTIDINATIHSIALDTATYIPGLSYAFRWVDSRGAVSNEKNIIIPGAMVITDYLAGLAHMDFVPVGGGADSYALRFYAQPDSYQSVSGAVPLGFHYEISFCLAGTKVQVEANDGATDDILTTVGGHGAGIYRILYGYMFDNGLFFANYGAIKVDAQGTILASILSRGSTYSQLSGLSIEVTAVIDTYNFNINYETWAAYDNVTATFLLNAAAGSLSVPPGSSSLLHGVAVQDAFPDLTGDDGVFIYNQMRIG